MLTEEQLHKICLTNTPPSTLQAVLKPLNDAMSRAQVNTPQRAAMFVAQGAYESRYFTAASENLNYSADRLLQVFPRYFTPGTAAQYARKPEMIANRVYANRMGNGPEESGDGWRFRGRGFVQITGEFNYQKFAEWLKLSVDETVAYLGTVDGQAEALAWFWDTRHLNMYADRGDLAGCTRVINGGTSGLPDRRVIYNRALATLT